MECADRAQTPAQHCRAKLHCRQRRGRVAAADSFSPNGCDTGIPSEARKSDIGGYAAASEPVTSMPELLEHSRQRGHGRTTDADQMNVFRRHRRTALACTCNAGDVLHRGLVSSASPWSAAVSLARTPKGRVSAPLETWPDFTPKTIGTFSIRQNPHDDLLQGVIQCARLTAVDHLAEDDAPDAVELPRQLQLHQHAIDAVRPLGAILDEQDRSLGANLVRCTQRGAEQRQATAVQNSVRRSRAPGPEFQRS